MQRVDPLRAEATRISVHAFATSWPTPVLLLRYVVDGDLKNQNRGPAGTMRHAVRRALKDRLTAPRPQGVRAVRTERVAVVRSDPDQALRPSYAIGRDKRCDVVLNDYTISTQHARLHFVPHVSRWMIEDLGSTNQSYLNGSPLPPNQRGLITSLDELRLGRMMFMYLEPTDLYAYLRGEY